MENWGYEDQTLKQSREPEVEPWEWLWRLWSYSYFAPHLTPWWLCGKFRKFYFDYWLSKLHFEHFKLEKIQIRFLERSDSITYFSLLLDFRKFSYAGICLIDLQLNGFFHRLYKTFVSWWLCPTVAWILSYMGVL